MADTSLLRAVAAFEVALPGGGTYAVHVGDLFPVDDPIVVGREAHFATPQIRSSRATSPARAAETASATPGTRRLLTRAEKPTDKPKPGGGKSDA